MKRRRVNIPFKAISLALIILLVFIFIIGYICKNLSASGYFKVKEVVSRDGEVKALSYLKGRNIFSINLAKESQYILDFYPESSRVRLVRILPGRIYVDFVKRKPLAVIKLYKSFSVDQDGVIFYPPTEQEVRELPVIWGLETKIFGPKAGRRYNIRELKTALEIIREAKKNKVLKNYPIKKIDVANSSGAAFYISLPQPLRRHPGENAFALVQILEIKIGQDDIKNKIFLLAGLMVQEGAGLSKIRYIDLRFKDPVIKLKDVE